MDRRQISWLIIRAFGVYFLVQAFILLPELLTALFSLRSYSNAMSSLGSQSGNGATFTRTSMFPTFFVAPTVRIVLYSAAGLYMLRGGRFLVRLLERCPDNAKGVGSDGDAQQIVAREPD
jgi:hypothetical protein